MPEEVLILAVTAIIAGATVVLGITKAVYRMVSLKHQSASKDPGLPASELKNLIREAVEEAVEPLVDRVTALEQQRQLGPKQDLLEGIDTYNREEVSRQERLASRL